MTSRLRVLHLEDSPRDAELIRHKLEADGVPCDIRQVRDQKSFEAAVTEDAFDLILLDYDLPDYDGLTALKRAQLTRPEVPVILISGTVGERDAVECLFLGATDYLLKDRLERLAPAVERALREAETRRTRKRTEAALAESEARKAAILDSVLDSIITMDAAGTVIEFNSAAERTLGYTKADAIGRPLADLIIPPSYRERHRAGLAHYLATGEGPLIGRLTETIALRSDGAEIPVELSITAVRKGSAPEFTGVLRDITARKKVERDLRDERDRAQEYLDAADVILLKLDLQGRTVLINRYGCELLGRSSEELLGRDWVEMCVPPRIHDELRKKIQNLFEGDLSIVENPIVTKSGEERLISWRSRLVRDASGHVTGSFSSGTDITEQNDAVKALRASEERTQFVLENAKVGVWDLDHTTGVLRWSGTLEAQYGLSPGTFDGTFDAFVNHVHPDDRASLLETVGKAMTSGAEFSVLNRAVWPDGTVRWLSGAGRVLLGSDGQPIRAVGISLDVTERRSLEQQFQQAQKMEAVGQLAGGVAHDFNNLLTVILGFCELLLEDTGLKAAHHSDIVEIQKAGTRAAGLTRQLLAFSRKQIIEPTVLDLSVVLADVQPMLRRLIREDVKVLLGLQPKLACVMADRGEVEQIIVNLAVNARDAMPHGGTLTIETADVVLDDRYAKTHASIKPGPYVAVTVTDTGTGMTPEVQARMFEPFFTTKEPGKGTGLGMATVFGIVTRSGGSIDVQSAIGKGTSFKVYFPATAAPAPAVVASAPAARPAIAKRTVLVAEDEEGLRELTQRLLQRLGYTVLVAESCEVAVRLFDENPSIDVLLTDVVMPGGSGPALVRQLTAKRPELKVIYMSGYTDESIVQHGVLNSGIAFLPKPFTSETLGRKLREVLDRETVDRPAVVTT